MIISWARWVCVLGFSQVGSGPKIADRKFARRPAACSHWEWKKKATGGVVLSSMTFVIVRQKITFWNATLWLENHNKIKAIGRSALMKNKHRQLRNSSPHSTVVSSNKVLCIEYEAKQSSKSRILVLLPWPHPTSHRLALLSTLFSNWEVYSYK